MSFCWVNVMIYL